MAGPVVAAAVILRPGRRIEGVADSKTLSPDERAALSVMIRRDALCFGIGWADRAEIDAVAVDRALPGREEGLPLEALRIFDPAFLTFGVAAGGSALLEHGSIGTL